MTLAGTNRTRVDFVLGHLGLGSVPVAIIGEAWRAMWLRRCGRRLVPLLALALGRLVVLIVLAVAWLAAHLA